MTPGAPGAWSAGCSASSHRAKRTPLPSSGVEGLSGLEGAFLAAIWDATSEALTLVNDRFGLYPHYWAQEGGSFAFAPELKAVLAAPGVPRTYDAAAIAQYVRFQQLLGDRTWCRAVRTLEPATILRFDRRTARRQHRRYWSWASIPQQAVRSFDEAVHEASRLFGRAVDEMAAGERSGLYLTGGLDGRLILAFLRPELPVTTVTYGAAGSRDVVYARRLARAAGRPHRWFPLEDGRWVIDYSPTHLALTEGFHSWIHAHGISTCEEASRQVEVALSGWEGGTVLGGSIDFYRDAPYREATSAAAFTDRFYRGLCDRFTWPGLTEDEARRLWSPAVHGAMHGLARESLADEVRRIQAFPPGRHADYFYLHHVVRRSLQMQVVTLRGWLRVRCPYFDYGLVDFVYGLPGHLRTTPRLRRAMLTRRAPRLAWIPYEKDGCLPHENRYVAGASRLVQRGAAWVRRVGVPLPVRPRLYADYEAYLRADLRSWAEPLLLGPSRMTREWFSPRAVGDVWQQHLAGAQLWTIGKLAPLMTLELVCREIVGEPLGVVQT